MFMYRVFGLLLLGFVILIDLYTYKRFITAFYDYNYYSIGFRLLIHLYPIEMILLNDIPFLFRSRDQLIEKRWRLIAEGKTFYKSSVIKYTDYVIITLIIISILVMVVGGLGNYLIAKL